MKKIRLILTCLLLAVTSSVFAQNIQVSGIVTDATDGSALIGASVVVKGTLVGTSTDLDGKYTISVPADGVLEFVYVGYTTVTRAVNGSTAIDVALAPDSESLDEVVMVAYGTAKKSSFTGSATTIKTEKLTKRSVSNVSKAIEGLVAGVTSTSGGGQPGDGASIQIRGYGSINASSSPLYVVDGIAYDGSISSLNPNDIESMTVLKDAAASALYGARGANGVVMITTKKGKDGITNVNFKAQMGLQQRSLKRYDVLSQDEFVEITFETLRNQYYFNGGYPMDVASQYAISDLGAKLGGEAYNPYKNYTWETVIDPATGKVRADAVSAWNENWMDELTNDKSIRQEVQVGANGGNDKTKYAISLGYLNDQGVLITTMFQRYSARANVDHTINKWLQVGVNTNYSYTNSNSSQYSSTQTGNAWYSAQFMAPIYPVFRKDASGKTMLDENGNKLYDYGEDGRPKAGGFNVVGDLYDNFYETLRDNVGVRTYAVLGGDDKSLGALRGLTLTINYGTDISNRYITSYYNPFHGDGAQTQGSVDKYATRTFSQTLNEILKYDRTFGDHHILAQAGHEYYSYNYRYLYASKNQVYPGIPELAPAVTIGGANSYSSDYRIESYLGRLAYDFKDKYYFEATWRTDGSSRFYKENRWGQFWSVGGSWRISEEDFMDDASWVDNMTLRTSYGQLGNDDLGSYYAWQSFYDLTWANAGNPGALVSSLENKNVTWEKKGTWNAGIDATLFNRLLNVNMEYYISNTHDILLAFPMAMSTGFTGYNANIGSMKNTGVEATIRLNWLQKHNMQGSSTLMLYTNKNTVTALTGDQDEISGTQTIKVGMPIYTYNIVKTAGVDPATGQQLYWAYKKDDKGERIEGSDYVTANKTEAQNSKYYLDSRAPKFQGSFGSDFQFGPVDFSFLTTFSYGGHVYESVYAQTMEAMYYGDTWNKQILRRWQKPGDVTDVPAVMMNSGRLATDKWLIDASYFAIKSIQLGYTLPQKWTQKVNIKGLRVFLVGDNIAMFNHLNGMDPQYSISGGTNYSYAPTRTFSCGIDINF